MTTTLLMLNLVAQWATSATLQAPDAAQSGRPASVFTELARTSAPWVVRIETVGGSQPPEDLPDDEHPPSDKPEGPRRPRQTPLRDNPGSSFHVADGPTTGMVYSADGYIVTSSFNFVREPEVISIVFDDGRRLPATLVARDQVRKVALLKVEAGDLPTPTWATGTAPRVGQWAIALGRGMGGSGLSVSVGIVSALARMQGTCVQTDARLSPANYGGPLLDIQGRVVGMNVPMAQRPGELAGIEMYDSGVGFALTGDQLTSIVQQLKSGVSVYRGWLGIQVDPHRPDAVVIDQLADPSPMRTAGARRGDRIIAIEGQPVLHYGQFFQRVALLPAGRTVHITLARDGQPLAVDVTLAQVSELGPMPEESPEPFDPSDPHGQPPPHP